MTFSTVAKNLLETLAKDDPDLYEEEKEEDRDYVRFLKKTEGITLVPDKEDEEGFYRLLIRYALFKRIRDLGEFIRIAELTERYWSLNDPIYETCLSKAFSSYEIWNGVEYLSLRDSIVRDVRRTCFFDVEKAKSRYYTRPGDNDETIVNRVIAYLFIGEELLETDDYTPIDEPLLDRLFLIRLSGQLKSYHTSFTFQYRELDRGMMTKGGRVFYWVWKKKKKNDTDDNVKRKWFIATQKCLYDRGLCPGIFDTGYFEDDHGIVEETDMYIDDALDYLIKNIT